MAQQLYFSRDTRMFLQFRNTTDNTELAADLGKGALWEIPVLDGYSFSQTTNTSEITLAEMESSAGISRRGRRMFTDSLAPAEWSFSTYIRPFKSLAGSVASGVKAADAANETHAIEEALWASMFGADKYNNNKFVRNVQPVSGSETDVIAPGADSSVITIQESNRSALHSFVLYFMIETDTTNPLLYRMPEAIVNEVTVDFDVDGIATLNWSGFAKEIQDRTANVKVSAGTTVAVANAHGTGSNLALGDLIVDTNNSRAVHIATNVGSTNATILQAIDESTTSTQNFIRNRLTSVAIEAADQSDKVAGTFPGQSVTVTAITEATPAVVTAAAHGFAAGDVVRVTGTCGISKSGADVLNGVDLTIASVTTDTFTTGLNLSSGTSGSFSGTPVAANGKYSLTLTGGSFNIGNNITYLVPEELGAINKPLEHVTGTRTATGNATCYLTLEDTDSSNGTSRQFFNDLVGTGAMNKVVNKFKVTMAIGGTAATANATDPALQLIFPTAHIEVPTHSIEDVISLETNFTALPTDFGSADEITSITYFKPATY